MAQTREKRQGRVRKTALDRRLAQEARANRRAQLTRRALLRKRFGWLVCAVGAAVFVVSFVGNFAGFSLLPFDEHHMLGQIAGGFMGLLGVIWATG